MEQNKPKKKYFIPKKDTVLNQNLFDTIRERLKLTKSQLPDDVIKKVCKLNNKLIGDWIVNNADGFQIKDNGRIIVSKFLPKCLRGDKLEKIEEIMNNPKTDDYTKEMFKKRYEKSLAYYKNFGKKGSHHINLHSFFYLYRIIWFNARNCKFDKAELYELKVSSEIKKKLNKKIIEGKEFYEWQFSDFRLKRSKDKQERKYLKNKKKNGS